MVKEVQKSPSGFQGYRSSIGARFPTFGKKVKSNLEKKNWKEARFGKKKTPKIP